jgi:hypothetical protein
MTSLVLPAKPNWKITLTVDSKNQIQLLVEDQMQLGIPRALNQIEVAAYLTGAVSSILQTTLNIAKGNNGKT